MTEKTKFANADENQKRQLQVEQTQIRERLQ